MATSNNQMYLSSLSFHLPISAPSSRLMSVKWCQLLELSYLFEVVYREKNLLMFNMPSSITILFVSDVDSLVIKCL